MSKNYLEIENQLLLYKSKAQVMQMYIDLLKRIDRAIEYIEDWLFDAGGNGAEMPYEDIDDLLEILKGKE